MPTLIVDASAPDPDAIARGAALLRDGRLVAFPTETVYGLGAHALDRHAVRRIYEAKGRPGYNPLIVHVAREDDARALVADWPESAHQLAHAFWPGPLTLILRKRLVVPDEVTAGLDSVALRVPAHPVALALLNAAEIPVAAPSANRSSELSPTSARHVERSLGPRVDLILDAGPTTVGIESTVIDLRGPRPIILRPGVLGPRELEPVVGAVEFAPRIDEATAAPRASPGRLERHYAPRARLILFDAAHAEAMERRIRELLGSDTRVGALLLHQINVEAETLVTMPNNPVDYARRLYATLHMLDDTGCDVVFVERVPEGPEWAGVRDRLERAAT
jgi:L-threonylcarbamoyladenylate synthase